MCQYFFDGYKMSNPIHLSNKLKFIIPCEDNICNITKNYRIIFKICIQKLQGTSRVSSIYIKLLNKL